MNISRIMNKTERLILRMLCDLYRPPEKREFNPEFVSKATAFGHLWALDWEYGVDPQRSEEEAKETAAILDMWRLIEANFDRLSTEEKERVISATETPAQYLRFEGFDGNDEPHYGIARFMIKDMGRWKVFRDRELNCHYPSTDGYLRMLSVYRDVRSGSFTAELTVDQLIQIFNARKYPHDE